jgi:hypothetical protein
MREEEIDNDYNHPYASLYAMATSSDEYLPTTTTDTTTDTTAAEADILRP